MSDQPDTVVIIGGGPAGADAATFTTRAGLSTVVIDADKGMTRRALVANHLGFPDGITGPDLVDGGHAQSEHGRRRVGGRHGRSDRGVGRRVHRADRRWSSGRRLSVIVATGASVEVAEAAGVPTTAGTEPHIKAIVAVDTEGRTSVAGIWAAGTAAGVSVHTIVTAGDGARVAINLISEVRGERHVDHDVLPAN